MSIPDGVAEKELLLKVARGSEQAFRQLFICYHQWLISHIFRLTGSMTQAEEVVQDVFFRLWMNRGVLAGIQRFKLYLFALSTEELFQLLNSDNEQLNALIQQAWLQLREEKPYYTTANSEIILNSIIEDIHHKRDDRAERLPAKLFTLKHAAAAIVVLLVLSAWFLFRWKNG